MRSRAKLDWACPQRRCFTVFCVFHILDTRSHFLSLSTLTSWVTVTMTVVTTGEDPRAVHGEPALSHVCCIVVFPVARSSPPWPAKHQCQLSLSEWDVFLRACARNANLMDWHTVTQPSSHIAQIVCMCSCHLLTIIHVPSVLIHGTRLLVTWL